MPAGIGMQSQFAASQAQIEHSPGDGVRVCGKGEFLGRREPLPTESKYNPLLSLI